MCLHEIIRRIAAIQKCDLNALQQMFLKLLSRFINCHRQLQNIANKSIYDPKVCKQPNHSRYCCALGNCGGGKKKNLFIPLFATYVNYFDVVRPKCVFAIAIFGVADLCSIWWFARNCVVFLSWIRNSTKNQANSILNICLTTMNDQLNTQRIIIYLRNDLWKNKCEFTSFKCAKHIDYFTSFFFFVSN